MLPGWRLDPPFRFVIYIAFAVLFASGAAWLGADRMKESANGEIWQQAAATLLMVHGGAAMLTLMLLGALFPLHIGRAWRAEKNRATGIVMLAFNAVLIATAFGLYYPRLGNFVAMGERPPYRLRPRHALAFSGARQDRAAEARLVFVHAGSDRLQTDGARFLSDFAHHSFARRENCLLG